jgi:peptide/nickel transport system permease protein
VPVLLIVTMIIFFVMRLLPGDPVLALVGESAEAQVGHDEEAIRGLRESLGLNDPIPVQYVKWLGNVMQGDLGRSARNRLPVADQIRARLPVSAQLGVLALLLSLLVGIPCGVIAALKRNTPIDYAVTLLAMGGVALPSFWFSMLLIWIFVVWLGWFPASGFARIWEDPVQGFKTMALPVTALGLILSASLMRQSRSSLLDTLRQDYVTTARAKGLKERTVIVRHALRNGLLPVVTVVGLRIAGLLEGSVIIESMFSIPGIGRLATGAIGTRDYPTLQGVVLLFALITIVVNLLTDLSYTLLDPTIKYTR